jgi:hypothetical protein
MLADRQSLDVLKNEVAHIELADNPNKLAYQ